MSCIGLLLFGLLTSGSASAATTAGYLPWWSTSTHTGDYFTGGAFDTQVSILDEVVYFGEFQLRNSGRIHYAGMDIVTAPDSNWYIAQMLATVDRIRTVSPGTRLTFSIGGAGNSDGFPAVAASAGARATAAADIVAILTRFGFDGVDLDWEGVTIPAGDVATAVDYGLLTQEIRAQLGGGESITVTLQYNRYEAAVQVSPHVDRIRVMTYDAPELHASGRHTSPSVAGDLADLMIAAGIPAEQLGIGAAFYGYTLGGYNDYQAYHEIDQRHLAVTGSFLPDHLDEWDGMGFDAPGSVLAKVAEAEARGLQEVFAWELTQDAYDPGHFLPLTEALATASGGGGGPGATLTVGGSCPGPASIEGSGLTPGGMVFLLGSAAPGTTAIGGGPCAGTVTALATPSRRVTLTADGAGGVSISPSLPPGACGKSVQLLDLTSCVLTNPVLMP